MKRIVIVEDDQIVANIYRNRLSVEGFQVEVALDGQAGLELVHSYRPDAVVLDLMLPKMNGIEVMKHLRAEPAFKHLPVVVFSNTYLSNLVQEAWKAGATKCLSKANCTPKQVVEVVRGLFANGALAKPAQGAGAAVGVTEAPAAGVPLPRVKSASPIDDVSQLKLREAFVASLPGTLSTLRNLLQAFVKASQNDLRLRHLGELSRRIHALTSNAGLVGMVHIAQLAAALEALLRELYDKPQSINPSTLRTVAMATDLLGILFDRQPPDEDHPERARILVVDDEPISTRAVSHALEKARLTCVTLESSAAALKLAAESPFDLIILDVDMPGMNGFELCTRLRALPAHKKTPVVFVTSLTDFESRANSMMSGGNDLIGKPFLFIELAVKALIYWMRARLDAIHQP